MKAVLVRALALLFASMPRRVVCFVFGHPKRGEHDPRRFYCPYCGEVPRVRFIRAKAWVLAHFVRLGRRARARLRVLVGHRELPNRKERRAGAARKRRRGRKAA